MDMGFAQAIHGDIPASHHQSELRNRRRYRAHRNILAVHRAEYRRHQQYLLRSLSRQAWRRPEGWRIVFRYATIDGVSVLKGEQIPFQWAPDRFANGVPSQTRDDPSYVRPFVNRRERFVPPDGGDYLTVADLSKYGRGPHPGVRPAPTDMDAAPDPSILSGVSV